MAATQQLIPPPHWTSGAMCLIRGEPHSAVVPCMPRPGVEIPVFTRIRRWRLSTAPIEYDVKGTFYTLRRFLASRIWHTHGTFRDKKPRLSALIHNSQGGLGN